MLAYDSFERDEQLLPRVVQGLAVRRAAITELGVAHIGGYVLDRVVPMLPFEIDRGGA